MLPGAGSSGRIPPIPARPIQDSSIKEETMQKRTLCAILALTALALLATLPTSAADRGIIRGIDPWITVAGGKTFADFTIQPIPAGFFCSFSDTFTGRLNLRGIPLVTGVTGELGRVDTIIERLDDAVFNRRGVATSRIQVKALRLVSEAPLVTACGAYNAFVTLNGEQPITRMRIIRENALGGRFEAPVSVNVKISFVPVDGGLRNGGPGLPLELTQTVNFVADPKARWSYDPGPTKVRHSGPVLVDTNNDLVVDTLLPGTSNFVGGRAANLAKGSYDADTFHAGHVVY
jgi:hypothetical protein